MNEFPPGTLSTSLLKDLASYWDIFHDGYFNYVKCDFASRSLNLEIELALPKLSNDPGLSLTIEFSGLRSVYAAVTVKPEDGSTDYEVLAHTVGIDEFREIVLRERSFRGVIYDAKGIETELGVSIFLNVDGGLTINATRWRWLINNVSIDPVELMEYARKEWERFSQG